MTLCTTSIEYIVDGEIERLERVYVRLQDLRRQRRRPIGSVSGLGKS
jgi:hypothetical protein